MKNYDLYPMPGERNDDDPIEEGDVMSGNEPVEIDDVIVEHTTAAALLCDFGDGDKHWIPRSQILEDSEIEKKAHKGDEGTLVIPQWLAEEKELV
jgi:hypothetical protein